MKNILQFFAFFSMILLVACEKVNNDPIDNELTLVGYWELSTSFNPWTGVKTVLSEKNHHEVWEFQNNDTLNQYINGVLEFQKTYTLRYDTTETGAKQLKLQIESGPSDFIDLSHEKFTLDKTPYDGLRKVFLKL